MPKPTFDRDLKERLDSFDSYGIPSWVKQEVWSLMQEIQFLRNKLNSKKPKIEPLKEVIDPE